ncbi:MAG: ABC transporter substrate-binding protein [Alphaproteobacteria bacterium]|nr:ABC transporter substrate-binding protein [Alphaproteobacteria bacterium]
MSLEAIEVGFVPLVDAAALIVAREMGFAAEEGLDLRLVREPSWSNIRDKVALGIYPAAHMLAPMPLAMSLGAGAMQAGVIAPFILNTGGGSVGVSHALAAAMGIDGPAGYGDARAMGVALLRAAARRPVAIGAPFPQSMHVELLRYWLEGCGGDPDRDVTLHTVPPPLMTEALAAGEIDAFCVGEPWGSLAVERGVARLALPGAAIWAWAPEKALGVRRDWAGAQPDALAALLRALFRAGRWLGRAANLPSAAELMASPGYLGVSAMLIERGLTGALSVDGSGAIRRTPRFIGFDGVEASFPWRSQAQWIAARAARRWGFDAAAAHAAAAECFRPDLYRAAIAPLGADLPGASSKVEGALESRIGVASAQGGLFLGPDRFFDRREYDPDVNDCY